MEHELRQALELVQSQLAEAAGGYGWDEQAEFFGELADWAYGRHEELSAPPELELQDYENDD